MALTLSIENFTQLPDGGPLSISVSGKRGIDIGRDTHLDWTLPDPTRYISGKHCEVRYKDGGYWLYDVSTNGTLLYGAEGRLKGPHLLRHGDRLVIGQYIIAVAVDGEGAAPPAPTRDVQPSSYAELWTPTEEAAPPVTRSAIQSPREAPAALRPDFLDWAADVPDTLEGATPRVASRFDIDLPPATSPFDAGPGRGPSPAPSRPAPLPSDDDLGWAHGAPKPLPQVEPPPAVPNPRRPVWVSNEPDGPWGAPAAAETRAEKPAAPAILDEVSRSPTSPAMPSAD